MPYCPECAASVPERAERCPTCNATLVNTPRSDAPGSGPALLDTAALESELAASLAPRYEVLRLLGVGGMGAVYLAREPALKRLVAVKVLAPALATDPRARARFEREARAAAALSHPNVVRVYAVGETSVERFPYIVMQYVEGATLAQWISGRRKVAERDARRIIGEVAAALAAAHARDLVHRDVKPGNVLIETESGRAFVVDFGVAAALSRGSDETRLTTTGMVVGTPVYMSPEQAVGEPVTPKSDVYSLGLVAYEMLAGQLPFKATTTMGWAAAHLRDRPPSLSRLRPDVAPEIVRLVDRCLAKAPGDRPSASELARVLVPTLESEVPWPPPGLSWLHSRARVLARVSLLSAAGGLLAMFALAFTPRVLQVHPLWLTRFGAFGQVGLSRQIVGDPTATPHFVWQTLLVVGIVVFVIGFAALVILSQQTGRFLLTRGARGWHWRTLWDVAVDPDGRTGSLIAGTREFASIDAGARTRIIAARRVQAAVEIGSGFVVAAVAAGWSAVMLAGGLDRDVAAPPVTETTWWAAALPTLVCLVLSLAGRQRERRLMGSLKRRDFAESEADIAAWYGALPQPAQPAAQRRAPGRLLTIGMNVVTDGTTLVLLFCLTAAVLAAMIAAVATNRVGPRAAQISAVIAQVDRLDPIGAARRSLAPRLPVADAADDATTSALLRGLVRTALRGGAELPDYNPSPATVREALQIGSPAGPDFHMGLLTLPAPRPAALPLGIVSARSLGGLLATFRRAAAGRVPEDTVRLLATVGHHPRTRALRVLARSPHWDLAALLGHPVSMTDVGRGVPSRSLAGLSEAALANMLGAVASIARGDPAEAEARLGENAAVGLRMLEVPDWIAAASGVRVLETFALSPLAELAQLRGDARQAAELREAAARLSVLEGVSVQGIEGLAADPADQASVTRVVGDSRLPVAWRVALMARVYDGGCTNPREILRGASAMRRSSVTAAAAQMPDVAHADELATLVLDTQWSAMTAAGPMGMLLRMVTCLVGR